MYLSKKGYVIRKDTISNEEIVILKKELRATPLQNDKYTTFNQKDTSFPIYIETKNKLYIPKIYGIKKYGLPEKKLLNYIGKKWDTDIEFKGKLFPIQEEAVQALLNELKNGNSGGILSLATGLGKCMKKNTPILMFSGSIKMVQDVQEGDLLMGDDSTPRTVLSLARGVDEMYDIIPTKGEKYTVNKEHILCLKNTKRKPWVEIRITNEIKRFYVKWWQNNKENSKICNSINEANELIENIKKIHQDIVEISVKDYLTQNKNFKHHFKGYRVAIDFPEKEVTIDPYLLGYWLGDGTQITSQDSTVLHYFANKKKIKDIPDIYKINSRKNRLKLLAGLIDSGGSLGIDKCNFDIVQKSEKMIDDIIYLCRSLGFGCYKSKQKKGCWYKNKYVENDYYRIVISGNTNEIPTLIPRKVANLRKQIKDVLVTGIKVQHVGRDKYYGFTLDGNNRYVIGDFTVTHNTISALNVLSCLKGKTIIVVNKIPLMNQWESEIKQFLPDASIGFIQGQKNVSVENKDIVIAMLQSLAKIDYPDSLFEEFNTVVFDEIHNMSSKVFSQVLARLCCEYTIGLSATPKRSDGCEYVFKYHIGDIVYQSSSKRKGLHPIIQTIQVNSKEYKEITVINKMTGQNQIQFTSMLSELIDMEKRNRLIIEIIKNLVKKDNRRVLILSDRRQHVITLKASLDNDQAVTFTSGLFLGQMKQVELERSKSSQVILATFSAFGEGVSEKDLDTLILITPKKFIGHLKNTTKNESGKLEQIVGRIFRKDHLDKHPLIVDLQDNFSVYKSQSAQRNTFYKQHFNNAVIEGQTVNLDDFSLDDININSININSIIIKKKKQNLITDEKIEQNTIDLLKHCVIED
jgi:superfamily II DNA or RNA helicase